MCARKPRASAATRRSKASSFPASAVLLVEDLATDGRGKVNFVKAIRDADGKCDHCFVIFFYNIYKEGEKILQPISASPCMR